MRWFWVLAAAAAVLSLLSGFARSRRYRGRRFPFNAPARGWAFLFQVLTTPVAVLAFFQARESGGRLAVVVPVLAAAVLVPFTAVWWWHNHVRDTGGGTPDPVGDTGGEPPDRARDTGNRGA